MTAALALGAVGAALSLAFGFGVFIGGAMSSGRSCDVTQEALTAAYEQGRRQGWRDAVGERCRRRREHRRHQLEMCRG